MARIELDTRDVWTHDRTSFFKYCTAKTAKTILSSKKFRWSSPLRFNDPFDHLYSIATEDSPSAHKQWFIDECDRVVFGEDEPTFPHPSPYSMMLLELRQVSHSLDRAEFRREWDAGLDEGAESAQKYLSKLNGWWLSLAEKARLFCVSEENLNLLMWAHYSGEHSGVVLELGCIQEHDTPLCGAIKVEYRSKMPKIGAYRNMMLHALGRAPEGNSQQLYRDLAFVKAEGWRYENEWRCITYRNDEGLFGDYPFFPEEIMAVYFGCRIASEDRDELLRLMVADFPGAQAFQVRVHESEYALVVDRVH